MSKKRKTYDDIEVLDLLEKDKNGELWGDGKLWNNMKKWKIESDKFMLFCKERVSNSDFLLMFGKRCDWPELTDWSRVADMHFRLLREFEKLRGGEKK
jgi:hypothetical protein